MSRLESLLSWFRRLLGPPRPAPAPIVPPPVPSIDLYDRVAPECLPLISRARPADDDLLWYDALSVAAIMHARDMASRGFLGHIGSDGSSFAARVDRVDRGPVPLVPLGECVAKGQPDAASVVALWLASAPHRAILLDRQAGWFAAAVAYDASGTPYWCGVTAK